MATRSPIAFHAYWGIFATYGDLPNVAGAATQSGNLQAGDQAYSTADQMLYFCIDATVGAAIWSAMGLTSANFDAFGRLRISAPQTIFDAKTVYDSQPLYFAERQTGGAGPGVWSATNAKVTLTVAANQTSTRQSKRYFTYQPGKSQLIFVTFNLDGIEANTAKRAGHFDDDNGFFLELSSGVASLHRRSSSSTPSTSVTQASWNIDPMNGSGPSGVNLNFAETQILIIDFEWLGVGSARLGFVVNGVIYYAHRFDNANINANVYMTTPNLPIRWEIEGLAGLVGTANVNCICASVNSEGGLQATGTQYSYVMPASTANITGGATHTLLSFRHDPAYPRPTIIPISVDPLVVGNGLSTWELVYNPTFAPLPVAQPTWAAATTGYAQIDLVGQAVGGTVVESGTLVNRVGAANLNLRDTTLTLGADVAGVSDIMSLRIKNLSGGSEKYLGAISWITLT